MYKALYRKWRPQLFDDVISQSHVTDTLKNQLKLNKTAHAYLFTGSRGTGKTTCARIFAKALCCLNNHDGNPCLECEICKNAELSKLSDIIEIDAASNNSVDDIRDLREGAVYVPEHCKYKIYIIDEVHMLSTNAFNALLKIMEEPPEFVKFILATTEIHKVPATILSRCQRFDFKRINPQDISARLLYIAKNEGFTLSEDASLLIAKLSDGGMRDAISLLDQCSAYSENITEEVISQSLGIAGREYLFDILDYLSNKDTSKIFEILDTLYIQSKDLLVFCSDVITQLRNAMILKVAPTQKESIACMPNELDRLSKIAENLSLDDILLYLENLESCLNRMAKSGNKRIELEITIANICNGNNVVNTNQNTDTSTSIDNTQLLSEINAQYNGIIQNLTQRLSVLENRISNGMVNNQVNSFNSYKPKISQPVVKHDKKCVYHKEDVQLIPDKWDIILQEFQKITPATWSTLNGSIAELDTKQNCIFITPKNALFKELFKNRENANYLNSIINKVLGGSYRILVRNYNPNNQIDNNTVPNGGQDYNNINNLVERAKSLNIPTQMID